MGTHVTDRFFGSDILATLIRNQFASGLASLCVAAALARYAIGRPADSPTTNDHVETPLHFGTATIMLLFFWPAAVAALFFLSRADDALSVGDINRAQASSGVAQGWLLASALVGLAPWGYLLVALSSF